MRQAYLDCSSGISGDMFLAALIDAGAPVSRIMGELSKLPLGSYEFNRTRVMRNGLVGTRLEIQAPGKQPHRHLSHIQSMIENAALPANVASRAIKTFRRLAEVEGRLHNVSTEKVHFHEVGAVDAVLDIVGTCMGMDLLEIDDLVCSPLNVGGGRVEAAHGTLPVPAPATAELLKGIPVYSSGLEAELVTPTGAALVAELASSFGPLPSMTIAKIGYGAGEKEFHGHPNLARLFIGVRAETISSHAILPGESVISVIEANVDDMSPQVYGYFLEQALAAGALDVTCSSVQMKKNRPGLAVSILCETEKTDALCQLLFDQTTTIGVRITEARRKVLHREKVSVETVYGTVQVKVARRDGQVVNAAPEFDDCRRLALEKSVPLKQVIAAAEAAYLQQSEKVRV